MSGEVAEVARYLRRLEQRIAALEHQWPAAPANPNPKRGKTRTA